MVVEHPIDPKRNNVEAFVDLKPNIVKTFNDLKPDILQDFIDLKPNIAEVSVDLETIFYSKENTVKLGIFKPVDNEVDMTEYFFTNMKYKVMDDMINWIRHQASTTKFTLLQKNLIMVVDEERQSQSSIVKGVVCSKELRRN